MTRMIRLTKINGMAMVTGASRGTRMTGIVCIFPVFYACVGISLSQKDDNFRVMDGVLFSSFDITTVSQYLWV